jgi:hypothetical protein
MPGSWCSWPTACEPRPTASSSFPGAEALIEEARQRQRRRLRRWALLGASLVVLAAAAVTGGIGLSGRAGRAAAGSTRPPPPGPAVSMPSRVVVWTDNFKIEVLSSRTGRLLRTLATNVALNQGIPTLAVSPAGVLYFDDARGTREFVLSVPLAGGPVTTIADGRDPAISPDGRMLAYVTYTHRWAAKQPEAIVVRDLPAGTQRTWAVTSFPHDITNQSWTPDGRFLAFAGITEIKNATVTVRTAQVLDTRSGGTLDGARRIPLGQRVAWAGFLSPQAGAGVMLDPHGAIQTGGGLVEVGVSSGRVLRRLTSLPPHGLATGNAVDGTEGAITVSRTGRYLLIAGMGNGHGEIFRWTFGMLHPVRVTSGALIAEWLG